MTAERDDRAYLWEMLRACEDVTGFIAGRSFEEYEADRMLRYAVERAVQIIGEGAWRVSDDFKRSHDEVPRPKIAAQRHRITHEYYGVDHERVWRVATDHIPVLADQLRGFLPDEAE